MEETGTMHVTYHHNQKGKSRMIHEYRCVLSGKALTHVKSTDEFPYRLFVPREVLGLQRHSCKILWELAFAGGVDVKWMGSMGS